MEKNWGDTPSATLIQFNIYFFKILILHFKNKKHWHFL